MKCEHGTENCPGKGDKHACIAPTDPGPPKPRHLRAKPEAVLARQRELAERDGRPRGVHPAEVNEHLGLAYGLCDRLIEEAERRGDQDGADAWLVARNAIEASEKAMREAREKQTWKTHAGERVDRR